ncbi:glucose 1-dehydrogenase [Gluconobacter roseus]|uniref:Oxidoreductase n=1 Tax=Gluconobacter roseus NBRC 3990 TaxID=1307950 RepID=A0A4Y3M175_9PROT|nr:glucose 1-dehydrogenase [Gluconobacter roseus]KXV45160.1 oxidoreductase [Gluconobacter roseus]GEB02425.1 oxidoreductase [Gluconobacter roseus NBRC 3990]GLP94425.1 oxidoreductase [Gluconobacter roseus NBRC 3990]
MNKLAGKVAVVTGASKGIGSGIAEALAAAGAAVIINYASSKVEADAVVTAITEKGGKALAVQGDVSSKTDAEAIIAAAISAFGRLDILVNNSGIYEFGRIEEITPEHFHRQFNVNVLGLIQVTQAAVPYLGKGSSIINISSVCSQVTPPNAAVYVGTKGAVDAITGSLAKELGPKQIRVNAINPGLTKTEGTHSANMVATDRERTVITQTPLQRVGEISDIAPIAVFLASDDARWLTGEILIAAGGLR